MVEMKAEMEGAKTTWPQQKQWRLQNQIPGQQRGDLYECGMFLLNAAACRTADKPTIPTWDAVKAKKGRWLIAGDFMRNEISINTRNH